MATYKTNRAFTMIELMLVLAILGIAAGIAFPAGATMLKQAQARAAAGRIASLLNCARAKSVATGTACTVVFDKENRRAELRETGQSVQLPEWLSFDDIEGAVTPQPEAENGEEPNPLPPHCVLISFLPDGSTDKATIHIGANDTRYRTVIRCPSFGRCRVGGSD